MSATWHIVADRLRRALEKEDEGSGLHARCAVEEAVAAACLASKSPDPELFAIMLSVARRYVGRITAHERARLIPVLRVTAQAVCDLATEEKRLAEEAARVERMEREGARAGLPAADRL